MNASYHHPWIIGSLLAGACLSFAQDRDELYLQFYDGVYTAGSIHGQQGWKVVQGEGLLVDDQGQLAFQLPASDPPGIVTWAFPEPYAAAQVIYVRVIWSPLAFPLQQSRWTLDVAGARVTLVKEADGTLANWYCATEDKELIRGRPVWMSLQAESAAPQHGATLLFRIQRTEQGHVWDMLSDFQYVFANQPLDPSSSVLGNGIAFSGSSAEVTGVGSLLLSTVPYPENLDLNRNGIADNEESYRGQFDDLERYDDLDGDGLPSIEEIFLRTNPRNADTDDDGVSDGDEVRQGTDPLAGRWPSLGLIPSSPSDADITDRLVLDVPTIIVGETTLEDRITFLDTIESVSSGNVDLVEAALAFIKDHPNSPFRMWLGASAGQRAFGARRYWIAQEVLEALLPTTNKFVNIYLARLYALRGAINEAKAILASVDKRTLDNILGLQYDYVLLAIENARAETPWKSWSGYKAVTALARDLGWSTQDIRKLSDEKPTGSTGIIALRDWALDHGLDLIIARRDSGSTLVSPSVVLWKHGHYAAVIGASTPFIVAATATQDHIVAVEAWLNEEGSGYYLVPANVALPDGWSSVLDAEVEGVGGELVTELIAPQLRPNVSIDIVSVAAGDPRDREIRISGAPGVYRFSFSRDLQPQNWTFTREIRLDEGSTEVIPLGAPATDGPRFFRIEHF